MLLLSQDYVNQNAAKEFKLHKNLTVDFLLTFLFLNHHKFKKVSIVKDFIAPVVDYVNINHCDNLPQLQMLSKYLE
jgi:hypothetical protein